VLFVSGTRRRAAIDRAARGRKLMNKQATNTLRNAHVYVGYRIMLFTNPWAKMAIDKPAKTLTRSGSTGSCRRLIHTRTICQCPKN
jgi:hypothetical protein